MREPLPSCWISPRGAVIPLEPCDTHIRAVCRSPRRFGLSQSTLAEIFARHGEPLGFEGRARQAVMKRLILKGWIRIRYRPRTMGFRIQAKAFDRRTVLRLQGWARQALGPDSPGGLRLCRLEVGTAKSSLAWCGPVEKLLSM